MTSMPDVAPTLMMIAPFLRPAHAHHRPRHAARQGMRPHRRAHARAAQARRRRSKRGRTTWCIEPLRRLAKTRPTVVEIETYHDHRIAMSFGVLGSRLPGLRILDPGCVAKTYPNYWRDWQRRASRGESTRARLTTRDASQRLLTSAHASARHRSRSPAAVFPARRGGGVRARPAFGARPAPCAATSTTSPASITWSTTASIAPPRYSRASPPSPTRPRSSSRSAA